MQVGAFREGAWVTDLGTSRLAMVWHKDDGDHQRVVECLRYPQDRIRRPGGGGDYLLVVVAVGVA